MNSDDTTGRDEGRSRDQHRRTGDAGRRDDVRRGSSESGRAQAPRMRRDRPCFRKIQERRCDRPVS